MDEDLEYAVESKALVVRSQLVDFLRQEWNASSKRLHDDIEDQTLNVPGCDGTLGWKAMGECQAYRNILEFLGAGVFPQINE